MSWCQLMVNNFDHVCKLIIIIPALICVQKVAENFS